MTNDRDECAADLAAQLPDGEAELLQAAARDLDGNDDAIRANDEGAAREAHERGQAIVW